MKDSNYLTICVEPDKDLSDNTPTCTILLSKDGKKAYLQIGDLYYSQLKVGKGAHDALNLTFEKILRAYKENNNHEFFIINNLDCCCQHAIAFDRDENGKHLEVKVF